jgi:hypothetical protein
MRDLQKRIPRIQCCRTILHLRGKEGASSLLLTYTVTSSLRHHQIHTPVGHTGLSFRKVAYTLTRRADGADSLSKPVKR